MWAAANPRSERFHSELSRQAPHLSHRPCYTAVAICTSDPDPTKRLLAVVSPELLAPVSDRASLSRVEGAMQGVPRPDRPRRSERPASPRPALRIESRPISMQARFGGAPGALGCASRKRSRLPTSIPSACCCASSAARGARTAMRCYRRSCLNCCAPGGGRAGAWVCCCRGAGSFRAAIRSSRSRQLAAGCAGQGIARRDRLPVKSP